MRFEGTDELRGAQFVDVDLSGAEFRNVNLAGARLHEAMLVGVRMSGLIDGLVVNDVEVGPLIAAELDRRYPERTRLRPTAVAGVRDAWAVIEELWSATKQRADGLPDETRRTRVDGEWSLIETLRHLVFVTDLWVGRNGLGRHDHFHPIGLVPTFISDVSPFGGVDPGADPTYDDVVVAREDRMRFVADLVADVDDTELARRAEGSDQTLLQCLRVVFDEEWHHNWYANRDLDTLANA
jgi:uncharacterized protein YjbI with pentapeptide repeats